MATNQLNKRTETLWHLLQESPSVSQYIAENAAELAVPSFATFITELCRQRGERPEHVIRRAGLERSFGHQLFKGTRRPSRDTVLQLAFGFEADIELAQALLKYAQHSPLYPRSARDATVIYCLFHRFTATQAQCQLAEGGHGLMGAERLR